MMFFNAITTRPTERITYITRNEKTDEQRAKVNLGAKKESVLRNHIVPFFKTKPMQIDGSSASGLKKTPFPEEPCQKVGGLCQPTSKARQALESDSRVQVLKGETRIAFVPNQPPIGTADTGLIIFPGAMVDFKAYAVVARKLAERGFTVVILNTPNNMLLRGSGQADLPIAEFPKIQNWALAGHSLGGILATQYLNDHPNPKVKGVAFWASFPHKSLVKHSAKALFIQASRDNLLGRHIFYDFTKMLPQDVQVLRLNGGNHSQFGDYGLQTPDWPATLSRQEQQQQIVDATANLLERLAN